MKRTLAFNDLTELERDAMPYVKEAISHEEVARVREIVTTNGAVSKFDALAAVGDAVYHKTHVERLEAQRTKDKEIQR